MSNPDSFIDEVTEEVRRDKLFGFFRKYGWIPVLAVVAIVAGAAWSELQKSRTQEAARAFGDSILTALELPDNAARTAALAKIATDDPMHAAITGFSVTANAVALKDQPAALAALDVLIADPALAGPYHDLALLKRIILAGSTMPAPERLAAFDELATPGRPFRPMALEQKAMVQIETGETATAITGLKAVLQEPLASQSLKSRVSQVLVALGVDPKAE